MIGPGGSQPVAVGERPVEMAQVGGALEIGQFVHDHVRSGRLHGSMNRPLVERIRHDGLGAKLPHQGRLLGATRQAHHHVPGTREARKQCASDRPVAPATKILMRNTSLC
jgi:hypothetical protein